ncbi:HpcH/HpaI aldolase/citrate lyase family protein [Propionispira raffinosivorans]|uniref:HpcH/HpaI aldolase/citrate lyase family protein n=1 Tax=Propionispira raffinosivorans TaxID=86959 RepID=UPI000374EED0|nr:CoA ester lyase [Propionispira raffinosivorans]
MDNSFKYHSFLVTPSLKLKDTNLMNKVQQTGVDISILDLEDAIPPSLKDQSRELVKNFLMTKRTMPLAIRINNICEMNGLKDLNLLSNVKYIPEVIIVPGVETANEISCVRSFFTETAIKIFAVIETTKSVISANAIASVSDGLIFGSADYAASVGIELGWDELLYARYVIVTAAANNDIPSIDTPCFLLNNEEMLNKESKAVKKLGFTGKIAIHPNQVNTINKIFKPSDKQLEWAAAVVKSQVESKGEITKVNGEMIGPPFVARAKKILAQVR